MRTWSMLAVSACGFTSESQPLGDARPADARIIDAAKDASFDAIDSPPPI